MLLECKIETLSFILPKTTEELIYWGKILNNCMGTYCKFVLDKSCIILGIFKNKRLLYAIEVQEKEIIQMSRKNNQQIDNESHLDIINQWTKDCFIKDF